MEEKPNALLYIIATIIMAAMLMSCSTTKRVTDNTLSVVEVHDTLIIEKIDSVVISKTDIIRDSVYVKDSTSISRDSVGNTLKEVWHYKYLYHGNESKYEALLSQYKALEHRKDSVVHVDRVKTEIVKEELSWKDKLKMDMAIPTLVMALIMACVLVIERKIQVSQVEKD